MAARKLLGTVPPGLEGIPGDRGKPLVGYTFEVLRDPLGFARARYERYGPVSWTNAWGTRIVSLNGPDAIAVALQNKDRAFSNGEGWTYFIGPFFRRGIMLLDFDEHLHHRRIMQQAFTRQQLAHYLEAMNPVIASGLGAWESGLRGSDTTFAFHPAVKKLTLDIATDLFMGGAGGDVDLRKINEAFFACVQAGTAFVRFDLPGGRWHRGLVGRKVLESFFTERLPAHRTGEGRDLFTALCDAESEDGHRFTDTDIVNHMIFLLMAAHDTTTITLTSLAYYLGRDRAWQQRCREESEALGNPAPTVDDLEKLPSLDLAVKEALRLVTPVPTLARKTVQDTEILGHHLPGGTMVGVGLHFTHHMPELWPDPERFDPERFSDQRREDKVHRYAWSPFGGGVHKCIGMHFAGLQTKAVMHRLLLDRTWSVPADYVAPFDFTSLPYPRDGLPVALR